MAETKKITKDQHIRALALFTMAAEHYAKAREFETALHDMLGYDDSGYCGCISDEMSDGGNFERGLKKEGFVVVADKPKRKAR